MTKPALTGIAPVAPQLSKLIPLLASDQDGEVVATARAIGRVLTGKGLDWSDLSQAVGEIERLSFEASRSSPTRQPSVIEMVARCQTHGHGKLSCRDRKFILTIAADLALGHRLSARQSQWLRDIYTRLRSRRVS
jgi:hypothetical protein